MEPRARRQKLAKRAIAPESRWPSCGTSRTINPRKPGSTSTSAGRGGCGLLRRCRPPLRGTRILWIFRESPAVRQNLSVRLSLLSPNEASIHGGSPHHPILGHLVMETVWYPGGRSIALLTCCSTRTQTLSYVPAVTQRKEAGADTRPGQCEGSYLKRPRPRRTTAAIPSSRYIDSGSRHTLRLLFLRRTSRATIFSLAQSNGSPLCVLFA